jgi:Lrp/AsnC family transcriptional regulator for asnA, asnC and gidA
VPIMDEKDRAILRILQRDARTPFARIAKMLGVSETTVYLRVRRLSEAGILKGYHAVIDPFKAGFQMQAFILLKTEPGRRDDAASAIAGIRGVYALYDVTGEYNLLAHVMARSREELTGIISSIGRIRGIRDLNTIYVLDVRKEERMLEL